MSSLTTTRRGNGHAGTPRGDAMPAHSLVSVQTGALLLLGAALGALAAALLLPAWLPRLAQSVAAETPKAYWYLSRSSGLVAYVLLWLSVVLGLLLSNRLARAWPGALTAADLHQFASILALTVAAFHALVLLGDRYMAYSLVNILLPFGSAQYRPIWVGLGQIGLYLSAVLTLSFAVRRRIGYRAWRALHYASFAVYSGVTLHGLLAGTDASAPPVVALYVTTAATVYALTIYRILTAGRPARAPVRSQA